MLKKKKIILVTFQNNSNLEKQFILLMIPNEERWHYIALKKPALLRGIMLINGDF